MTLGTIMNFSTRIFQFFAILLIAGILPLSAVAQVPLQTDIQYTRPDGQAGATTFEAPIDDTTSYDGFELKLGGAFTQQLQGVTQSNDHGNLNDIGRGFNLATANLDLDAQMARGIQLHVRTYLSSRHHPEAWVKGGYLQVDELPMFDSDAVDAVMNNLSIRAGHFMPNYGDTHFRRTDNADAIHNPFVGNTILDAFTTEVGAEARFESNGVLVVGGFGGALNPTVTNPDSRAPSWHGKVGYDSQLSDLLRVRLTGSVYYTAKSNNGQLHSGDRAGSRYYNVGAANNGLGGGDWSGRIRSSFGDEITAFMINPFVQVGGFELFGTIENVTGSRGGNLDDGTLNQYAGEAIYRFLDDDLYVGARYNTMNGDLELSADMTNSFAPPFPPADWNEVTVNRWQLSAGWFMTNNILVKAGYVTQSYEDYPETISVQTGSSGVVNMNTPEYGAEFDGVMIEGVVSF